MVRLCLGEMSKFERAVTANKKECCILVSKISEKNSEVGNNQRMKSFITVI